MHQQDIILGTRTSTLARWQTNYIIQELRSVWPELTCHLISFKTKGDQTLDQTLPQIGGKGLFTAELEQALLKGKIDMAVHSLKDLPTADTPELTIGAISKRADVRDCLVSKGDWTLQTLPEGACVGTSSFRRQAQLLAQRPDLNIQSIRGNVDTRLKKVKEGDYDATVLAAAGIERLGLEDHVSEWLDLEVMLPAPGQGALAVQCHETDQATLNMLQAIHQLRVAAAVTAERSFLASLNSGCSAPVGAYACPAPDDETKLKLKGIVASPDGQTVVQVEEAGYDPIILGQTLAQQVKEQGTAEILAGLKP